MTPPLFALGETGRLLLSTGGLLILVLLGVALWLLVGRGPRRRRAYQRGQKLLHEGHWEAALAAVQEITASGRLSSAWQGRVHNLEGEAYHAAGDAALKEGRYEEAVQHYENASRFLSVAAGELRGRVIEAMLTEATHRYAAGPAHNEAARELLERLLKLQPDHAAGFFWQGLCLIRDGQLNRAAEALARSHQLGNRAFLDPPLYLGMVLHHQGKPQEALRPLADANRVDANCPFVPLQLGLSLIGAQGDAGLAARALQRALGPRGLTPWLATPQRAWVEGLPEGRSYIRRLATREAFACPFHGGQLAPLVNLGRFALAQAHDRLGQPAEAADLYEQLLKDSPPSAPLLRGLGFALARLERYDQAYKHLRIALELEPKHQLTAGMLALCGALGKPTQADDKPRNVAWAVTQVARYEIYGDPEWARIVSRILAEARALDLPIEPADQLRLCDVLASVFATGPEAAAAYDHLAATAPDSIRPEHAWIWCQAAHLHRLSARCGLALFGLTFRDAEAAQQFYRQRGWDFEAVEYAYLERAAQTHPGRFPEEMGSHYADRGTGILLKRSKQCESAGDSEAAVMAARILLQLAPTNTLAHDRLARLHVARGELDQAASLLAGWHRLEPTNHLPLVRRAVVEARRGNATGRSEAIRLALDRTRDALRAGIARLGAHLALAESPAEAEELLLLSLKEGPEDTQALSLLAMLRCVRGDLAGLAELAPRLDRPDAVEPRVHYLAAVCHMAAGRPQEALEACRRAWAEPSLTVECRYLMGWASLQLGDEAAAVREWEVVARTADSPSAAHAQGLLGRLRFQRGHYEEAAPWWSGLGPAVRRAWGLDEPLRATVFLAGLQALESGRFEQAAERFREAGQLGWRDRRLGPLLVATLVRAGRQKLFSENGREP